MQLVDTYYKTGPFAQRPFMQVAGLMPAGDGPDWLQGRAFSMDQYQEYPKDSAPLRLISVTAGRTNHAARVITSAFRSNARIKQARRDEALRGLARSSLPRDTWQSIYASSDLPPRSIGKVGLHAMGLQRRAKRTRRKRARR